MSKYKSKGFTLAEVLIVLGIIGVVAALSAPALIQHAASAKVGPALSRCISIMANGFQAYLLENDAETIMTARPSISNDPNAIFQVLANNHVKMSLKGKTSPAIKTTASGNENKLPAGANLYELADTSAIVVPDDRCKAGGMSQVEEKDGNGNSTGNFVDDTSSDATSTPYCTFYFLPSGYGSKHAIALGDDAFELAYDARGNILVYGYDYGQKQEVEDGQAAKPDQFWGDACSDTAIANFTPASDKSLCGGRIVAKGFKKDY